MNNLESGSPINRPHEAYSIPKPIHDSRILSFCIGGVFFLGIFYTLYFARSLLIPIVAAVVFFVIFTPVVRKLTQWRIPMPISGAAILVMLLAVLLIGVYTLAQPLADWRQRAPGIASELTLKFQSVKQSVQEVQQATEEVEKLAEDVAGDNDVTPKVKLESPSLLQQFVGGVHDFGIQLGVFLVLLYFLLTSGDIFTEKVVKLMDNLKDKKLALKVVRQVQREVSTYFFTIALINISLGTAIGISLFLIGIPNAPMWGAMAAMLNFLPYVGAIAGVIFVGVVSLLTFDSLSYALIAPASYIALNVFEAQFVTPSVLGRRFTLNPVVIFSTVIVWSWLWGIAGAFLAVPLLVVLKAFCDNLPPLHNVGEFMRGRMPQDHKLTKQVAAVE